MTDKILNMPTPSLIYPKSSGLYLMSRVQELTANVADLIETLCGKDRQIATYEAILNDPDALRKRLDELTGSLIEHPDIRQAQGNGVAA